jgi:hypothetical protein
MEATSFSANIAKDTSSFNNVPVEKLLKKCYLKRVKESSEELTLTSCIIILKLLSWKTVSSIANKAKETYNNKQFPYDKLLIKMLF